MKIALFATCISDVMFPQAAQATVHLLERLGHEVYFPEEQGCCGQMHINTGYYPESMPLIRNHVKTFTPVLDEEWDAIVVPSGSCTGSMRHQQELVARDQGDVGLAVKAKAISDWRMWAPTSHTPSPTTPRVTRFVWRGSVTHRSVFLTTLMGSRTFRFLRPTYAAASAAPSHSRIPRHQPPCCPTRWPISSRRERRSSSPEITPAS